MPGTRGNMAKIELQSPDHANIFNPGSSARAQKIAGKAGCD